jgi:V-type H+-transporting ATPase subunit a
MKGFNAVHFRRPIDFFFEFIPQIVLMMCLFGYMDFLIIVKWLTNWEGNTGAAPAIIATMIGMFLKFGEIPEGTDALVESADYQMWLSQTLLLVGLTCVPLMLLVKPLWHLYTHPEDGHGHSKDGHQPLLNEEDEGVEMSDVSGRDMRPAAPEEHKADKDPRKQDKEHQHQDVDMSGENLLKYVETGGGENHDFSEIFIHQLIETIEFVLGTVSNTASYLRLWALSLAHSQLAAVFYEKLLAGIALEANEGKGSSIMLFLLFPAFFSFTFFVLMCMDAME